MKLCLQCGFLTRNPDRICDDCHGDTDKKFRIKMRDIRRNTRRKAQREDDKQVD